METCRICNKHKGTDLIPPGGFIYEDDHWLVCHAAADIAPLGTLFIESRRHFLDFAEFNAGEQATYGAIASKVSAALKKVTNAERIYQLSMVEGIPHFHVWLIPRMKGVTEHGVDFLAREDTCNEDDAIELANQLRKLLK